MNHRTAAFLTGLWIGVLAIGCSGNAAVHASPSGLTAAAPGSSQTAPSTAPPTSTGSSTPAVMTFTPTETGSPAPGATGTGTADPVPTMLPPAMCSPLSGYTFADLLQIVSNPFAAPRPGKDDGHHGIDFAHYVFGERTTIAGVPVAAAFGGTVAAAIAGSSPYGNFVIIETGFAALPDWFVELFGITEGTSAYHLYAHLVEPPAPAVGEPIGCGETFGQVGNSGWSGNYHLHFEIRLGPAGAVFESMSYYSTTTTEEERANYERWRFGGGEFVPVDPLPVFEMQP